MSTRDKAEIHWHYYTQDVEILYSFEHYSGPHHHVEDIETGRTFDIHADLVSLGEAS